MLRVEKQVLRVEKQVLRMEKQVPRVKSSDIALKDFEAEHY